LHRSLTPLLLLAVLRNLIIVQGLLASSSAKPD